MALASVPTDVFALHSLPSSTKVVYLDFDGHLMQNEYWNSAYKIGPFDNQPYDIDGIPSAFSDTERARILEIWQRVADDYAPFDIDVTTQDPGIDGLRRTSATDTTFGSRVVITSSDWYAAANGGTRIGGIALLNVFTSSTDHASYVFSSNLGSGHAKYVADATSHEAGHTLSLEHDGTSTAGYYSGHGSWGPIMGTPYSRAVTQWSHGQYPDANNTTEDDLADIGARGGFRPDDHADTSVGATVVSAGTRNGFIGVGGSVVDVDVFQFTPTGGSTQVTVTTPAPATNLLARLTVRDGAGGIVTEVEPSVASGWSLTAEVPASAGAFTVEVSPTSWLTPSTGFVTYGSLGAYTITFAESSSPTTTPRPRPPRRLLPRPRAPRLDDHDEHLDDDHDVDEHDVDEHDVDEHHVRRRAPRPRRLPPHRPRRRPPRPPPQCRPAQVATDDSAAGVFAAQERAGADGHRTGTGRRHAARPRGRDTSTRRRDRARADRRPRRNSG